MITSLALISQICSLPVGLAPPLCGAFFRYTQTQKLEVVGMSNPKNLTATFYRLLAVQHAKQYLVD